MGWDRKVPRIQRRERGGGNKGNRNSTLKLLAPLRADEALLLYYTRIVMHIAMLVSKVVGTYPSYFDLNSKEKLLIIQ